MKVTTHELYKWHRVLRDAGLVTVVYRTDAPSMNRPDAKILAKAKDRHGVERWLCLLPSPERKFTLADVVSFLHRED